MKDGCILGFMPLHDMVELRQLEGHWLTFFDFPWNQPVDEIKVGVVVVGVMMVRSVCCVLCYAWCCVQGWHGSEWRRCDANVHTVHIGVQHCQRSFHLATAKCVSVHVSASFGNRGWWSRYLRIPQSPVCCPLFSC
jgi:hypothetical protein